MLPALFESKLPEKGNNLNRPGHTKRAGQLVLFIKTSHLLFFSFLLLTFLCVVFIIAIQFKYR